MANTSGTYVYCIVKSARKPSLAKVPPGLPGGGAPRGLQGSPGTWLIVADIPLTEYSGDTIDRHLQDLEWVSGRAMAHEAVVEFCAHTNDVIPMKLFTIFRDDRRALARVGEAGALATAFRRIAGCAEWSVRVSCSPSLAAEVPRGREPRAAESGAAFLKRKKSQRDDRRQAAADARRTVDYVFARLNRMAKDSVRKDTDAPGSRLVLDAAFLVPRSKQPAFERECARLASSAGGAGCELVLSGPWPAYHFVGRD